MNIVIIFTLIYMLALLTAIVVWLADCSRKERLKRVKNFKRGKFAFIYIAAIPLFFLAYKYNGQTADGAIWLSVRSCIEAVVLKFDYSNIVPLLTESLLYHVAIECLYSLIILNTLLLTLSFCGQWLYNHLSFLFAKLLKKKLVAVVGTDKNALDILASVPKGYKGILIAPLTPALKEEAYLRKAACFEPTNEDDLAAFMKKLCGNFEKRKVSVILKLEDDEKSLRYAEQFCTLVKNSKLTKIPLRKDVGLAVYIFASKTNEAVFARYVEGSQGIIRFINRHKQIAMDFIDRYPMTQFMTAREIDYSTATIRDEIGLNVLMVGFGKLNESLFLASVSNNQFLAMKNGKLTPKPVTYHIYDRYYPQGKFTSETKVHSGSLHHGYLRYEEFLTFYKGKEDEFLDWAPMPAKTVKHPLEVTHPDFYASMRPILLKENSYNYIIISYGTDMENIELAEKLRQKLKEWEVKAPVKIFVKVRDEKATRSVGNFDNIIFFGSDSGCVYNAEVILHEKIDRMARAKHLLYTAEYKIKDAGISEAFTRGDTEVIDAAREKWFKYKEFQRESNIYACLSARLKLQLCGYDYAETGTDCSKQFLKQYEKNDARTPSAYTVEGKTIWNYSNGEQFRTSLRWNLVVQEHQRWCANMIASGLIPCSKKELWEQEKDELLEKRKHGNLTTMEGLVEFRETLAKKKNTSAEKEDVIRFDYQIMDDIDWLLKESGYKIIQKNTEANE